jgi:hypothetical protein
MTPETAQALPPPGSPFSNVNVPQGLSSTFVFAPPPNAGAGLGPAMHGPKPGDEEIDIPGTHVPPWVVVLIVVAVMGLLAATAFLLLD